MNSLIEPSCAGVRRTIFKETTGIHFLAAGLCLFLSLPGFAQTPVRPFPQQLNFAGCIKPNNVTQSRMDSVIKNFYRVKYKARYLGKCPDYPDQFYMSATGIPPSGTQLTVSEQHGYAMIISVLMAGYDDSAKIFYDGMYKLYRRCPSTINGNFMSWEIMLRGGMTSGGSDAATDGDMDIAYSLLLAHYQWGGGPSGTAVTYLDEAKRIINALHGTRGEISATTYRTLPGDWSANQSGTRSSDWMIDHMQAYYNATQDAFWPRAILEVDSCIMDLTGPGKPGANTGLVPDFATGNPAVADPGGAGTGEPHATDFYWNGCRYPWRIGMGYQHYGIAWAKTAMIKFMDWATVKVAGNPRTFNGGYTTAGNAIGNDPGNLAFVGPLLLAACVDPKYQTFLNRGWLQLDSLDGYDSYNDAIGLLCMLAISGNWWVPVATSTLAPPCREVTGEKGLDDVAVSFVNGRVMVSMPAVENTTQLRVFDLDGRVLSRAEAGRGSAVLLSLVNNNRVLVFEIKDGRSVWRKQVCLCR